MSLACVTVEWTKFLCAVNKSVQVKNAWERTGLNCFGDGEEFKFTWMLQQYIGEL
jgi:hypothetical protein